MTLATLVAGRGFIFDLMTEKEPEQYFPTLETALIKEISEVAEVKSLEENDYGVGWSH